MRMLVVGFCVTVSFILVVSSVTPLAAQDKQPKYSIEDVMDMAHSKKGILKKVLSGGADKADKEKLVELYVALGQNKPPRGSAEDWKMRTDALVSSAKSVAKGADDGIANLKKAANCTDCHKLHKG
jgi:hypothetical protein